MRYGIILAAGLLAVLSDTRAATQPNGDLASPTQQTMVAGTSQPVWYLYALHPDCTTAGSPIVQIVRAASHGSVAIKNVDHFTEYPSTNERYECNKTKSPSLAVIYSPEPSFVGIDTFMVQSVFPSGDMRIKYFKMTVTDPKTMPSEQGDAQLKPAHTSPRVDPEQPPKIGAEYYPLESLRAREQGRCVVTVTVLSDGRLRDVEIQQSTGYPRLDQACLEAFAGGRLIPATENGVPIDTTISLPVVWRVTQVLPEIVGSPPADIGLSPPADITITPPADNAARP
jgi:TonB family protein